MPVLRSRTCYRMTRPVGRRSAKAKVKRLYEDFEVSGASWGSHAVCAKIGIGSPGGCFPK